MRLKLFKIVIWAIVRDCSSVSTDKPFTEVPIDVFGASTVDRSLLVQSLGLYGEAFNEVVCVRSGNLIWRQDLHPSVSNLLIVMLQFRQVSDLLAPKIVRRNQNDLTYTLQFCQKLPVRTRL